MGADRPDLRAAFDLGADPETEHLRVPARAARRDGDGEPAAADAPHDAVGARRHQPSGDLDQQLVADLVAEGVVDLAEGVDGDGSQDDIAMALDQHGELVAGLGEVGEPRQEVGGRRPSEVGQQPPALQRRRQLGADGLQQPQVLHVEAAGRTHAVGRGQDAHQTGRAHERGRHAVGVAAGAPPQRGGPCRGHVRGERADATSVPSHRLTLHHDEVAPATFMSNGQVELLRVQQQADAVHGVGGVRARQLERTEILDEGVEPLGRSLLQHGAAVRPVAEEQSAGEPEQDRCQRGLGGDADHGRDPQRGEHQRHRCGSQERSQHAAHLHRNTDEPPDRSEQHAAHQVPDEQTDVEGEPVLRSGVLRCDGDRKGGRADLEAGDTDVVQGLEGVLTRDGGQQAGCHDAGGHVEQRCDQLHAECQRQLDQRHAL